MSKRHKPKTAKKKAPEQKLTDNKEMTWREKLEMLRSNDIVSLLFSLIIPMITMVTLEWIARGTLASNKQGNGFFESLIKHFPSFLVAYLLLVFIYIFITHATGQHWLATLTVGLIGNVPAVVTYYKLTMRGEPFLPWDISQIDDLMGVSDSITLDIQASMIITLIILVILTVLSAFLRLPRKQEGKRDVKGRLLYSGVSLGMCLVLLFGIFLNPIGSVAIGIKEDMWMQDRYYRTNGVITGFLTNLQMMRIDKPGGYNAQAVQEIAQAVEDNAVNAAPYYSESYAAQESAPVQTPDIIYLMGESFWDVTALEGIAYDQPVLSNFERLVQEGASGHVFSPSFGGGTCDVEFEVLTGFSMEHLPSGSKPYQQYLTTDTFSVAQYLKSEGYDTVAVHGYGSKFWNRRTAYPNLGIDEFVAQEDFVDPIMRRGFISDESMIDRIIEEYENKTENEDASVFIHAVTMQNHTTYNRNKYPESELVHVTEYPDSLSDSTIGQLEDCATGIREMDAALGKLTDYLSSIDRPTIVVFWGDHLNPMSDGYNLFEETGFIAEGETNSPELYKTPLLIWSNYATNEVDLGTISAYNLSAVMMDLYGIDKPIMFEFLMQQMDTMYGRTRGVTINPDGTTSLEMTEAQQETFDEHSVLQYDYLFGERQLEDYVAEEAS